MAIPGNANLLLLQSAAAAPTEYAISRSIRLNSPDSAFLSRTPSTAGNRKTWTWAAWVKRSNLGTFQTLFSAYSAGNDTDFLALYWTSADALQFSAWNTTYLVSTPVYRDASAWYHIVCALDTTQATASNRARIYINGSEITTFSTDNRSSLTQNADRAINGAFEHTIARRNAAAGSSLFLDGYLADVHFIDGQALDPTSFGEFDADTGIWNPIEYTGSYGTNGFHLPFSDNSSAAALGDDTSGNNNDWTVNNITTTPGRNGVYISGISGSLDTTNGGPASSAFNGLTSAPGVYPNAGNTVTWTPPSTLTFASTARVYVAVDLNGDAGGLSVNSSTISTGLTNAEGWVNIASAGSPISSIQWSRASSGSQGITLRAVEIDGSILVDNSFSVGNDSLVDVPTNGTETDSGLGAEVRGNYATLNPLKASTNAPSITNGNLDFAFGSGTATWRNVAGTFGLTSGKWYWEVTATAVGGSGQIVGIASAAYNFNKDTTSGGEYIGVDANSWGYYSNDGKLYTSGSGSAYGNTYATNDVIGVALDVDNGKVWFSKNGTYQNSGSPTGGTNAAATGLPLTGIFPAFSVHGTGGSTQVANFGQRPFAYSAPSGYKALCTANLPAPTVENGSDYMDVKLYTGNGSTQTISGLGFSPDWVWIKSRSTGQDNNVFDAVRGVAGNYYALQTNATTAEGQYGTVSALTSDGFTLSNGGGATNFNNTTYVAWTWDAGSSTASNTDGSITSSVRANPTAGFSVATFTGASTGTVGHGLNAAPSLIIMKARTSNPGANDWFVYHKDVGNTKALFLNSTATPNTYTYWNNTSPTSSVFSIGSGIGTPDWVAYCFAPVEGYSSFGTYTGNGSSDGTFVFTGMRPRWIMVKASSISGSWYVFDTARDAYNAAAARLVPNTSSQESTSQPEFDLLSNGFKLRGSDSAWNGSGSTYIYAAFAENPFALNARAR